MNISEALNMQIIFFSSYLFLYSLPSDIHEIVYRVCTWTAIDSSFQMLSEKHTETDG